MTTLYLTICTNTVATLALSQTSFTVVEGNLTEDGSSAVTNRTVCVRVLMDLGGLQRDIVIDVTTEDVDATSKRECKPSPY